MSSTSRSGLILRDSSHYCRHLPRCLISPNRELCLPNIGTRYISRRSLKKMPEIHRRKLARLTWEQQKRDSLRTTLIRQYEEEERPKWARNSVRLGQSFRMDSDTRGEPRVSLRSQEEQNALYNREEDVQCGIFWDIENVRNEAHPPAIVTEAIRDFAGCSITPVFQAYLSRQASLAESRIHAIYAQLGVTFIQCYDLGKDTADKKIISDMWKFYAQAQKTSPNSRIRIILLTGDRDFADAIGQLRNFGVEVGILTGGVNTTAPVYDDYTLGMRVLPLLGVIEARARDIDMNAYQANRRISLAAFEKSGTHETQGDGDAKAFPENSAAKNRSIGHKASQEAKVIVNAKTEGKVDSKSIEASTAAIVPESQHQLLSEQGGIKDQDQPLVSITSDPKVQNTLAQDEKLKQMATANKAVGVSAVETNSVDAKGFTDSKPQLSMKSDAVRDDEVSESRAKEEAVKSKTRETQETNSVFSRLTALLGLSKPTTIESTLSAPRSERKQALEISERPKISEETSSNATESKHPKSHQQSQLSDLNLSWTPPSTLSVKTPEIPLQSTIFSSAFLVPPSMPQLSPTQIPTIARLPPCPVSMTSNPDIIAFYTKEVLANKPSGISDTDMRRLLTAWLTVEGWGGEMKENQVRRAARMALSKAEEILALRKELRDLKAEEQFVEEVLSGESERSVFERVLGGERGAYPLTEEVKDKGIEEIKERIPTPLPTLETINTTATYELNITASTSSSTTILSPPPASSKPKQMTAAAAPDQGPKTTVNTSIADIKPAQRPGPESQQSGNDTLLRNSKTLSNISPPTPLQPASLRQSRYPSTAETLVALSARDQAAKQAWINEARDRLGG